MGAQSSRIIWGKRKDDQAELTPITLYDSQYTIYTYDNQCIYNDKLYKCITAETGGEYFNSEEWKEAKGVGPFATTKSYKINALCIYQSYVYRCIQPVIYTSYDPVVKYPDQYPDYWEQEMQSTGLVYSPRDHKDVYYDDGRNAVKWHRMMYFIPPELEGDEELAVTTYDGSGNYFYKKNDLCIGYNINHEIGLYKCRADIPVHEDWNPSHWERQDDVTVFDVGVTYHKDDQVIYEYSEIVSEVVTQFNSKVNYNSGQYVIDRINKYIDHYSGVFDFDYELRISGGEEIYGCYILTQDITAGQYDEFDHRLGTLTSFRMYTDSSAATTIGEYFIRVVDGEWVLSKVVQGTPPKPFDYVNVEELHNYKQGWFLFKSFEDQVATHFNRDKWLIVTQKYDIIYDELYGVIWKKIGVPGNDDIPFMYPTVINGAKMTTNSTHTVDSRLDNFFPNMGGNKLEVGETFRYIWETYQYSDAHIINKSLNRVIANKKYVFAYTSITDSPFNDNPFYDIKSYDSIASMILFDGSWVFLKPDFPIDASVNIVPTTTGFIYLASDNDADYYNFRKVILNADGSAIISETVFKSLERNIDFGMMEMGTTKYGDPFEINCNGYFAFWRYDKVPCHPLSAGVGGRHYNITKHIYVIDENGNEYNTGYRDDTSVSSFQWYGIVAYAKGENSVLCFRDIDEHRVVPSDCAVVEMEYSNPNATATEMAYWRTTSTNYYMYNINLPVNVMYHFMFSSKSGDTLYYIETYYSDYGDDSSHPNVQDRTMQGAILRAFNASYGESFIKIINISEDIGPGEDFTKPFFSDSNMYNVDDAYAYFCNKEFGLYGLDLLTGQLTRFYTPSLVDYFYLIQDIPYYGGNGFTLGDDTLYYLDIDLSGTSGSFYPTIENGKITIPYARDMLHYVPRTAYCSSLQGSPAMANGAFLTGEISIHYSYNGHSYSYHPRICIYLPNFKETVRNNGGFFWFSNDLDRMGYGGPGESGFEGW